MAVKLDRWEGAEERSRDDVFAELYESSYPSLVKYCRSLVGEEGDPEEIAQEAFLRAWMRWDRYATSRPFWALVATIARNLCMDHHRHKRVVAAVLQHRAGELTSTASATPDERVIEGEEYRWASEALSQLCPNHQRLLHLREIEGMSCDEVAAAEGTSPEAATAALYRARQRLRDAYNRVAAGAMAGVALLPFRGVRRRFELWAHFTGNMASTSPALVARAGETVATVVAIAVVSGAPVVNPLPLASPSENPAPVVTQVPSNAAASAPAVPAPSKLSAAGAGAAALAPGAGAKSAGAGTAAAGPAVPVAPDDVIFSQFTVPTPTKSRDLFAGGTAVKGCPSGSCQVLFHSPDGGTSWKQLKADGYLGGTLLLAPNYPADKRMFAAGPGQLQTSTDGGAMFMTVAPIGGPAAMSPAFSSGEPKILLGGLPGWVYDDDAETTTPLHLDPRPPGPVLTFSYSPGYPRDGRLLVGGVMPTDRGLQSATVSVCNGDTCGDPTVLLGAEGTPSVLTSRSFASSGQAFAWTGGHLFRSMDGGAHFGSMDLPAKASVQGLAEGPDGALYVALLSTDDKGKTSGGVFVSHDSGKGWAPLGQDTALGKGATSVSATGTRLLASSAGGGVLCSADAGKTWAKGCPAQP